MRNDLQYPQPGADPAEIAFQPRQHAVAQLRGRNAAGSDGSFGAALGVPTLDGLGPVCFDTCSRRERIVIASLGERATLFAALIARLAETPDDAAA
ncbi:hypothetical protein [Mangrovicoccus ximenensis]|uniref:hypothetical protein n=1 Tax=Mangrovicoccus ximenensis TaxID=1911570 RepID=UPI00191C3FB4|nr:hypothetical protein [Mangrovicoccus ximenensis]